MLILVLIDVQYSQNAVFSFEKDSNCQNHSSTGSHHPVKKSPHPQQNFQFLPPLTAIWKTLQADISLIQKYSFSESKKFLNKKTNTAIYTSECNKNLKSY